MLPIHKNKKVNLSALVRARPPYDLYDFPPSLMLTMCVSYQNPEEKKLFEKYGKLPTHKNVLTKMQKVACLTNSRHRLLPVTHKHVQISGSQVLRFWRLCSFKGGRGSSSKRW